jgi:cell filamentation protein
LARAEARIVSVREVEIATTTLPGEYNLEHYQRFHHALFRDVYDWAGQLRAVNIIKGDAQFGAAQFLAEQMSSVLAELERDKWLVGRPRAYFLDKLAYYYGELNARHPFREGNGRTLRAFLRQLSAAAGCKSDSVSQRSRLDGRMGRVRGAAGGAAVSSGVSGAGGVVVAG